jgi:protein-S-isoprenylcysteine O-methyltransferase Ste14
MTPGEMTTEKVKLNKYGRKELMGHIIGPVFITFLFFLVAGRTDMIRAWLWAIITILYYAGGMIVILKVNPLLLNERGNWNKKKDTKRWDKIMLWIFGIIGLHVHTILMALDVGRFEWSLLNSWFILPGMLFYTGGFNLVYWSMAENTHFEKTVRIQHERNHRVITTGPYRIVRHPGYAGLIMANFGSAMIVGSLYGFITAIATLLVVGIRTWLEDRDLAAELDGYQAYRKRVRYRLFPFVW